VSLRAVYRLGALVLNGWLCCVSACEATAAADDRAKTCALSATFLKQSTETMVSQGGSWARADGPGPWTGDSPGVPERVVVNHPPVSPGETQR
jgi:hypothetical protein